tara:strand:- start:17041 stop:17532 length:492 start_codon:yes stop_codon:yes gene_type:complete
MLNKVNVNIPIRCKDLTEDKQAKLPTKKMGDVGWDLYCIPDDMWHHSYLNGPDLYFELAPKRRHIFHTGISMAIPQGYAGFIWDRSGLSAKKGVHRLAGVIDSSYRGEILICLVNLGKETVLIEKHDRIAQMIIQKEEPCTMTWSDSLSESNRGEKGFASSGR